MKERMLGWRLFRLSGMRIVGFVFLVVSVSALLLISPGLIMSQANTQGGKPDKPPGKPKTEPALYRVILTPMGEEGMATDCNSLGYVLAEWDSGHKFLHVNGTMIDQGERIPLSVHLLTNVPWERKYEADPYKGLSGVFNGCYGETEYYHGALFIWFGKNKRQPVVSFTWHFDYYTALDVREHFTLGSEDIAFPAWTGEDIEGEVRGLFDISYYLNDPENFPNYVSLTDGKTLDFDFYLKIEKITQ